ncbi:MAG: D-isomer specific 2-hydroxyacid dehydrogenase NAD-binding protein [Microbacteriaceae bacterium]|nr:D-isomer specific 2-hydroxyacid dehydrogenase NAD-binding protein [Microbacteriaceae bacterium]
MPKPIVVIRSFPLDDDERAVLLDAAGPTLDVRFDTADSPQSLQGVAAVAGTLSDDELASTPALRWINLWSAGADMALTPAMQARPDIILTATLGNGAPALAEHAVMLMLLLARGGWHWADAQRAHEWGRLQHVELAGQTLGIVGLGRSGERLARIARAMDMRVLATRRTPGDDPRVDATFPPDRVGDMLADSDYVVVTAPLTPDSRGMIGEAEFRRMKPTARYVNISRGAVADEAALERALTEGWIAGAGLDAHHTEPLPRDSVLWDLPNVIVTPHNAATSTAAKARAIRSYAANLARFAAGEPLADVVDRVAGY